MMQRNRIPTIFSIYMVDVLCCALGCVVLLWQVNVQEAEEKTASASSYLLQLDEANAALASRSASILALSGDLASRNASILALSGELDQLKTNLEAGHKKYLSISVELDKTRQARDQATKLALVRKDEFDSLKKTHLLAEALLASLKLEVVDLQKKTTMTAEQLAGKLKEHAALIDLMAKSKARIVLLEKDIDAKKLELLIASEKVSDQSAKVKDADLRMLKLEKLLTDVRAEGKETTAALKVATVRAKMLEQDVSRGKADLTDSQKRVLELLASQDLLSKRLIASAKDLSDARIAEATLQGEKLSLLIRAKALQAQMDNRFAGIALTGRKILFLVDMSGSMELIDEATLDPDKWPIVCETLGRLMQSLADLRQFQVIAFSDRAIYPLRNDGRWIDFEGAKSSQEVVTTMRNLKPKGGTNMYEALNEAFRFRAAGLDTIYLLSDGLPNMGDGLPTNVEKLTETQKTDILAKNVRSRLKTDWNRYIPGQSKIRINTIGFFFESPDVGAFLWALAREHDGSFVGMSRP